MDLINQYELYVGHHDNRCARLKCIIEDLKEKGLEDLLEVIRAGDSHADAAFSVYIDRLFPELRGFFARCGGRDLDMEPSHSKEMYEVAGDSNSCVL